MGRKDTKIQPWDQALETDTSSDELIINSSAKEKTKESDPDEAILSNPFPFKTKVETIRKTFVIRQEIAELLDGIVTDANGKKIAGSKGTLSKIVSNGILEELVKTGVITKKDAKALREDY